jgi:hypothetical protein
MHTRWLSVSVVVGLMSLAGCAKGPSAAPAPSSTTVALPVDGGATPVAAPAPAALQQANQAPQSALKLLQ